MKAAEQLEFLTSGRETKRFHTWPVLHSQNIAEHSFAVAMLCRILVPEGELRVELLMAALTHDLAEERMGADMASPAKRAMPDYQDWNGNRTFREVWGAMEEGHLADVGFSYAGQLDPFETQILKLADAAEGALYCIRERLLGNQIIAVCFANFRRYIGEVVNSEEPAQMALVTYIDDMWEQANG